jgi:hypothetical protein
MSDIHLQKEVTMIKQSGRFKILSENNVYMDFKGLGIGFTDTLYEYKGLYFTPDHEIKINNKYKKIKDISNKVINGTKKVYDILHVADTNNYLTPFKDENDSLCYFCNKNCLVLDEFAFIDKGAKSTLSEEFIKSVFPTISSAKNKANSKIIIISTPNGMNAFYRLWMNAIKGLNDFIPYKIDWKKVPRSTTPEEFKNNQIAIIGEIGFAQEYECVGADTMITIRNEETGEEMELTIEEATELLNNEIKKINF